VIKFENEYLIFTKLVDFYGKESYSLAFSLHEKSVISMIVLKEIDLQSSVIWEKGAENLKSESESVALNSNRDFIDLSRDFRYFKINVILLEFITSHENVVTCQRVSWAFLDQLDDLSLDQWRIDDRQNGYR
jgi:hypothetical protein